VTSGADLLEAVRQNPDDRTLRLIYADWFEEQGDVSRAEFIRLQLGFPKPNPQREGQLLHRHRCRWDGELHRLLRDGPLRDQVHARQGPVHRWWYQRGFVEKLLVHPRIFLKHADQLFRLGPLQELRLVGGVIHWDELARSPFLPRLRRIVVGASSWSHLRVTQLRSQLGPVEVLRLSIANRQQADRGSERPRWEETHVAGKPGGLQVILSERSLTRPRTDNP
jgi:uncharacterized protein (TIGR02996 family)